MTGRGWLLVAALAIGTAAAAGCGGGGGESTGEVVPPPGPPGPPDQPNQPPPPPPPPEEPGFQFGTQGPWAVENVVYGSSHGIREFPVVGVTTDEAQNRWVATHSALYLLRPGEPAFHRFDEHDGLHMGSNRVRYCNGRQVSLGARCTGEGNVETWGVAAPPGISVIAGGGPGEVFVGYFGAHGEGVVCDALGNGEDWCDPLKHSGKIDRVRLNADGTLTVDRFDLLAINHGAKYWHNRTVQRLVYDHHVNPGALYAGTDHGVTILFPDRFRLPGVGEWFNNAYAEWMGDHLHARVCFERNCPENSSEGQRMGDWRGLAIDANGDLWHAGRWTAGLITYDPDPVRWFERNGAAFKVSFGDPYGPPGDPGWTNPPVFRVAQEGHSVFLTGAAVCPDGRVWFSSSGPDGPEETVAVYDGRGFQYFRASALGLPERPVRDIACLPDGRVVLAGFTTGLAIHDPATGTSKRITAGGGIPSNGVRAIEVDRMADPPALHVATDGGAAVLRVIP